jgi:glycosyltransferase involved in cell wall biosynthesis
LDRLFAGLKHRADSPEIYLALGEAFMLLGKNREAERFFITAANTKPEPDHLFLYGAALTYAPWLRLMQLYYQQEEYGNAFRAGMAGLQRTPESKPLLEGVRASLTEAADKIETPNSKKKNLYVVDTTGQFTGRLIEEWQKEYNVIVHNRVDYSYMKWADLTFVEWGDQNLFEASLHKFKCPLIGRVHRYEVYQPHFKDINWENVDMLIFTSEHIKKAAGEIPCKSTIIENAVDVDRFPLLKEVNPQNLVYIGYIHKRKNLAYLIQLLAEAKTNHILHIAGEFQDLEYRDFIMHQIKLLEMSERISFHGWQKDIDAWLEEIKPSAILSGSISEGLPYSILEAMAKGIHPIVYHYPGAEKQFPQDFLFNDNQEFLKKIANITAPDLKIRQSVIDRYGFQTEINSIRKLFIKTLDKI